MDPVPGAPIGFTLLFIVESGQAQRLRPKYRPILARLRCYERDTCGRLGRGRFSSSIVKLYVSARSTVRCRPPSTKDLNARYSRSVASHEVGAPPAQGSSPPCIWFRTLPWTLFLAHPSVSLYFPIVAPRSRSNFGTYAARSTVASLRLYGRERGGRPVSVRTFYSPVNVGDERRHQCPSSSRKLSDS